MLKDLKLNPFFVHSDARSDEGEGDVVNVNMLFFKLSRTREPSQGTDTIFTECIQLTRNPVSSVDYRFSMNYILLTLFSVIKKYRIFLQERKGAALWKWLFAFFDYVCGDIKLKLFGYNFLSQVQLSVLLIMCYLTTANDAKCFRKWKNQIQNGNLQNIRYCTVLGYKRSTTVLNILKM